MSTSKDTSRFYILKFWFPLAATWLMMSVEGPFLSALIARLADPKYNLAAYGVAFSLALIIEAPVIMMMSASTALVKDFSSYLKLRQFNYILMAIVTFIMILFNLPVVFYFLTETLIGLPDNVAKLTHLATVILLPWPGAIGYRRFYQGILISNNLTRRVAYGTIIRISSMSLTALAIYLFTDFPGVVVGASALSVAVVCEAVASRLMALKIVRKLKGGNLPSIENLTLKGIYSFYYPLAITSLLTLGVQPFVTFFIGQSKMAIESLAIMPVVTSFVFIFRGLGLSYQEVVIALSNHTHLPFEKVKTFAIKLGAVLAGVLTLIAYSPLADIWFKDVSGLSDFLTHFAGLPLMIMSFFPALTVLISYQRGILVNSKLTKPITYGTAIEFFTIIVSLAVCIKVFGLVGAVAATISFVIGRIAACGYLMPSTLRALTLKK